MNEPEFTKPPDAATTLPTGVPLQNLEDHLGRLIGGGEEEAIDQTLRSANAERDEAIDSDDEALVWADLVERSQDEVADADNDDAIADDRILNALTDSTRPIDLLDSENERPSQEGHTVSPEDAR